MKFAHLSDTHLGAWYAHPELRELPLAAFDRAASICIDERVDFVLISGDLLDNPLPSIDVLRRCVATLKRLADAGIAVYAIPGSHDFSPTGKTFLNVLEDAALLRNAARGIERDGRRELQLIRDTKTGAQIAGVAGRMGGLERDYFQGIDVPDTGGFRILMLHSGIEEYKPAHLAEMRCLPLSLLPRGFDYYASGHIHHTFWKREDLGIIAFPGALFPTDFREFEHYRAGFFIVETGAAGPVLSFRDVKVCETLVISIDAHGKSAASVHAEILAALSEARGKLVLVRASGVLETGKPSDIDFPKILAVAAEKGAYAVKKNISQLVAKEFEEAALGALPIEEAERRIIREHAGASGLLAPEAEEQLIHEMMGVFADAKQEGETNYLFEDRVKSNAKKTLRIGEL